MSLFFVDRFYDGIFGFIELTAIENEIVNTPIFQRLHHINQLGLAQIIFPNATHTRFSHSLGVLKIIDKMILQLNNKAREKRIADDFINDKARQILRLAALLHDVGHLPFSHAGENATEAFEKSADREVVKKGAAPSLPDEKVHNFKLHEELSRHIVINFNDVTDVLRKHYSQEDIMEIGNIIYGKSANPLFSSLLHSELDADRLDYLIRDSSFTGVVYGKVEIDQIISKLDFLQNADGIILGVKAKGIHAVEHYLLSRYYWYSQILNYPKMLYIDKILQKVYQFMIGQGILPNKKNLMDAIEKNNHHAILDFNDHLVLTEMRRLHDKFDKEKDKLAGEALFINNAIKILLSGKIPEPIIVRQQIIEQEKATDRKTICEKEILQLRDKFAEETGISKHYIDYIFIDSKISKAKATEDGSAQAIPDVTNEAIKVIDSFKEPPYYYLVDNKSTLINKLSHLQLQSFYLFVTYPERDDRFNSLFRNIDSALMPLFD